MTRPFDITAGSLPNGTLIEASAGTGKTHAVAAYVTRAIATTEDLRIGEVIVTTFTRNAVAELRERIRSRLVVTARLLRGESPPAGYRPDELDEHLLSAEFQRGSPPADMARRLERAAAEFDTAVIGTIHSVCTRLLRLAGETVAEPGDEELRDRVLAEVVNDTLVSEAEAGRFWDEDTLLKLVTLHLADPFLKTHQPDGCPEDHRPLLHDLPDLIHACVTRARERMRASPSFDELLVRAWEEVTDREDAPSSVRDRKQAFLALVHERYKLAIVDEAQDTNRLQWEFFHAVFPPRGDRVLFAVGDPKQAIYRFRGADVTAYVHHSQDGVPLEPVPTSDEQQHREQQKPSPPRRTLSVNRRSDGPLLAGLNRVMEGATFGEGIAYRRVDPARGRETARVVGLRPVEFLDVGDLSLVEAASRKVHELLTGPYFGPVEPRPFEPREICVLVRTNRTGSVLAKRLVDLGIPAVTEGTASVMAGQMARDIRGLFEAMERPSHAGRTRWAATTVFFGVPIEEVAALDDGDVQRIQATIAARHAMLQRKGIAAMAADIMADRDTMTRIAGGDDGDRRIVDFSHVVELLNEASRGRAGHAREFLEHLSALESQDEKSELVSRRVESDTAAVTIMTVHAAKGLQFPCVVVVDGWTAKTAGSGPPVFHRDGDRWVDIGAAIPNGDPDDTSKDLARDAENDELRRLLYVAVTRPEHHVCVLRRPPLRGAWMLPDVLRNAPATSADVPAEHADHIAVREARDLPPARKGKRTVAGKAIEIACMPGAVEQTYRRTSYSGIVQAAMRATPSLHAPVDRGHDEALPGAAGWTEADEVAVVAADVEAGSGPDVRGFTIAALPAGTAFGSVAHEILERVRTGPAVSEADLRADVHGVVYELASARFLQPHRDDCATMISDALLTPFGGPAGALFRDCRFADFGPADRLAEMDFEMSLPALAAGVQARHVGMVLADVLDTGDPLAAYAERLAGDDFDVPLAGLINGSIDAVLRLPGFAKDDPRLLIADYKTNRLHGRDDASPMAAYAPQKLVTAMTGHHYPLQALVYGTAIWRMLRWRLGPRKPAGWDPAECIAGVVYGFLRGMKGAQTPIDATGGRYGVFAWQPPPAIWRRLSDLFAGDLAGVNR